MKKLILFMVLGILLVGLASLVFAAGIIIWSGGSVTRFEIVTTDPVCDYENYYWKSWPEGGDLSEVPSLDDCFRANGWPSTTCCPEDSSCILESGPNFGRCLGGPAPTYCSEYKNQTACEAFHPAVGNRSVEKYKGAGYCGSTQSGVIEGDTCQWDIYDCRCEWINGVCEQQYSQTDADCLLGLKNTAGDCSLIETGVDDKCEETGFIAFSWDKIWQGTEVTDLTGECVSGSREVPCVSTAMLTFFTTLSLIIAILLLIIFYAIIIKKKRKYKGKKRR